MFVIMCILDIIIFIVLIINIIHVHSIGTQIEFNMSLILTVIFIHIIALKYMIIRK